MGEGFDTPGGGNKIKKFLDLGPWVVKMTLGG